MRPISAKRDLVEREGRRHLVRRGFRERLHLENLPGLLRGFHFFLRVTLTKSRGLRNAEDVQVEQVSVVFDNLPATFHNTRILLITDLHIDGIDGLAEKIISAAKEIDYDLCILGGDYSFGYDKGSGPAYPIMKEFDFYDNSC